MKMDCGVYVNCMGFKLGRKYLYAIAAYNEKVQSKMELTPELINKLESIKEKYSANDARRTYAVLELLGE